MTAMLWVGGVFAAAALIFAALGIRRRARGLRLIAAALTIYALLFAGASPLFAHYWPSPPKSSLDL